MVNNIYLYSVESDIDDILLLVPSQFPDNSSDEDICRKISLKQQYINVAKQTILESRPPERYLLWHS